MCRLDVERLLLEVKPKGGAVELIDLRPLLDRGRGTNMDEVDGVDGVDGGGGAALGGEDLHNFLIDPAGA